MPLQKMFLLINDEQIPVTVKDGIVINSITNQEIPESQTKGLNHILRGSLVPYNAKICSYVTNTPYHFWKNAPLEIQQQAVEILSNCAPQLEALREKYLKDIYAKRSKRANNAKSRQKVD